MIPERLERMSRVLRCSIALVASAFVGQAPAPTPALPVDALFARAIAVVESEARAPYATYSVVVTVATDSERVSRSWQTTEDIRHGIVLASSFSDEERANPTTPHGSNIVARRRIQLAAPRNLDPGSDPPSLLLKSKPVNPQRTADAIGPVALAVDQNFGLTRPRTYRVANDERTIAAGADELTIIGRTGTATARYRVELVDSNGGITHLALTPLRDPYRNRLRELWIETASAYVQEAIVQGVGDRAPFDRARWHVTFDRRADATFVTEAHPIEPLAIGGASPQISIVFENLNLLSLSPIKATFGIEAPVRYLRDP